MYSSGMFFVYLFSSALAFALVNRVLRHRLTWLSALSVLTALGWGYIFQGDYIVPAAVFFSFYSVPLLYFLYTCHLLYCFWFKMFWSFCFRMLF